MLMLKVAATDTVPSFLTHTFDEVSVWFFFCNFFIFIIFFGNIFLTFYKTLLYLQYSTGLSNDTSPTIIYWEHTTDKV